MPTYKQVNARSPYIVSATGTAGQSVEIELFLWNYPDSEPSTYQKVLSKPIPSTNITTVHFDLSPYLREYIDTVNFVPNASTSPIDADDGSYCYARAKVYVNGFVTDNEYLLALDGYGYFDEGYNPIDSPVLLTEGEYYVKQGGDTGSIYVYDDDNHTWEAKYVSLDGTTASVNGLFNGVSAQVTRLPYITASHVGTGGSEVIIFKDTVEFASFTFREICEPKYTPVTCDFKNKFGVWQRIVFFKVSKSTMQMNNNEYHLMPASIDYDTTQNVQQSFNSNGIESIKVNTGWVPESYSEVIKQLTFSESIRLDGKPVNINTKSIDLFKAINERNINYTIDFNYANHMINYVQ